MFTWPDGRSYKGDYMNDKKEGHGVFIWPDGRKFVGYWNDGLQDGLAYFTSAKGKTRQGLWQKGKRIKWVGNEHEDSNPKDFSGDKHGTYDIYNFI